jgi:DNA-directed RNA polymerase sigma subunit (sigma70/sigma32)
MRSHCTSEQWWKARAHDPRIQEAVARQRLVAERRKSGATFKEIAKEIGVCRGRARILYAKALKHDVRA